MPDENYIAPEVEATEEATPSEEMVPKTKVEEMMAKRVKREREAAERSMEQERMSLKKQIAELERKVNSGTATPDEKITHAQAQNTVSQGAQQGIAPEDVAYVVQHQLKMGKFQEKVADARAKDPELDKLWNEGLEVPTEIFSAMTHLDNPGAVIKQFLKDPKANNLMKIKAQQGLEEFTKFVDGLEDELSMNKNTPRPPGYQPPPSFATAGNASQDFDLKDFISSKYKRR